MGDVILVCFSVFSIDSLFKSGIIWLRISMLYFCFIVVINVFLLLVKRFIIWFVLCRFFLVQGLSVVLFLRISSCMCFFFFGYLGCGYVFDFLVLRFWVKWFGYLVFWVLY